MPGYGTIFLASALMTVRRDVPSGSVADVKRARSCLILSSHARPRRYSEQQVARRVANLNLIECTCTVGIDRIGSRKHLASDAAVQA
jgi:hypothetical protein